MEFSSLIQIIDPLFLAKTFGMLGIFAIVFAESGLFFGFFFPGDSLLFTAGFLASQGAWDVWLISIGCFIFAVLGDNFGYAFGNKIGPKIFFKEDSMLFKKAYVEKTRDFYEKYGPKTIIISRFIPVVRTFAPILAGVGKMDYAKFALYNVAGGALWSFSMVFIGYFLGEIIPSADQYILPIVLIIIFSSFLPVLKNLIKRR